MDRERKLFSHVPIGEPNPNPDLLEGDDSRDMRQPLDGHNTNIRQRQRRSRMSIGISSNVTASYDKMMNDIRNDADPKTLDADANDFLAKTRDTASPDMKAAVTNFDNSLRDGSYNGTPAKLATLAALSSAWAGGAPNPPVTDAASRSRMRDAVTPFSQLQSDLYNNPTDEEALKKDAYDFEVAAEGGRAPGTAATMDAVNNLVASFTDGSYVAGSTKSADAISDAAWKDGMFDMIVDSNPQAAATPPTPGTPMNPTT
jgi:hypothetical protein